MRDLNISSEAFDKELERNLCNGSEELTFLAEGKKAVNPTLSLSMEVFSAPYQILINCNNPDLLRNLAIRSWYVSNPAHGFELRRLIKTSLRKSTIDFSQRARILPLLESKSMMINYLVELDDEIHASEWYGNILESLATVLKRIKVRKLILGKEKKIPKYTGYCRGYRSSPHKESLISEQSVRNDIFLEKWQLLKSYRERLHNLNELATQLWIMREFEDYNLIKEELHSISESYHSLRYYFSMTEEQIENVISAENLHRQEKQKMFDFQRKSN